jgi:hypothetical protein
MVDGIGIPFKTTSESAVVSEIVCATVETDSMTISHRNKPKQTTFFRFTFYFSKLVKVIVLFLKLQMLI